MKKIALLIACALLGLTACSSSSNHSSTKETIVSIKEVISNHKEDEAEAERAADETEPEIEEIEPETEPEVEQKKGLDITSLTVGDETIYLEYCTVADVVKLLQKAGYSINPVLTGEVGPYEVVDVYSYLNEGVTHPEFKYPISSMYYYNPTSETCKIYECKVSRLGFNYIDNRISFVNGNLTSDIYNKSREDILNFLNSIPDTIEHTPTSSYVEKALESGQIVKLDTTFDSEQNRGKIQIILPELYE